MLMDGLSYYLFDFRYINQLMVDQSVLLAQNIMTQLLPVIKTTVEQTLPKSVPIEGSSRAAKKYVLNKKNWNLW
jgi:hypothetical protein